MDFIEQSDVRKIGEKSLETVLNQKQNINIIEKYIHKTASNNGDHYNKKYEKILYQTIGDIILKIPLKDIVKNMKKGLVEWDHPIFTTVKHVISEHDEFIINPFEVEEGVTECKCGSKRVFTYQIQTRSSDEPMTTICKCVKCGTNWSYSG